MSGKKNYGSPKKPSRFGEAKRICLACNKEFDSIWAGNRICKKCERRNVETRVDQSRILIVETEDEQR
jgi:nitrogenase subunit NifH